MVVMDAAFGFERQGEAGPYRRAVHENRARSAHPFGTSFLDAREAKIIAKDFQERGVGGDRDVDFIAVNRHGKELFLHHWPLCSVASEASIPSASSMARPAIIAAILTL